MQQNQITLKPIKYISGNITNLPGSKSISNRVLLLSALCTGDTTLLNLLSSDDVKYMLHALKALKVKYIIDGNKCIIHGSGQTLFCNQKLKLFLGNAGTAMRPLLAALSLYNNNVILDGEKRMQERPINHLVDALRQGGATITYLKNINFPPVLVKGGFVGGSIIIEGTISSQFLSSLLMMAPLATNNTYITVKGALVSIPYITLTINLMKIFGITIKTCSKYRHFEITGNQNYVTPGLYYIENDTSSATYFLAAAAIKGGEVKIKGIKRDSIQGDVKFSEVLSTIGANIIWNNNSIICRKGNLKGIEIDCNHIPDAAMTLAMIGLFSNQPVYIKNIYNWRVKETDRLQAMTKELKKVGGVIEEGRDYIIVSAPKKFLHAKINTYNDHRIAMCFSLVALSGVPVTLLNPSCVNKTFPQYLIYFSLFVSTKKYNLNLSNKYITNI
ncbi:3-phosphoshikimate 1-carboxyvinyltransferase [Buchnera aphidicola (Cinara tujafilina)]|uniref:3-phosphoshikimate 1-carboxyvinyltransferase n=1 Tax=Buchnera aphidicola (Cinara tujafilina) TaxID=261317 RepID=F7WZC4_9GAMM|nr:3-phosphoshikimate 1-carboxyvinyltransferase [Buchnera aphidicola]AEH39786.1 3-phosphoshikimate 1-carboxyvinyltransferase [Buchnera aphidicola (Cinara tujafilina)]